MRHGMIGLLAGLLVLAGCGVLTPKTAVSYSPLWGFGFADTKDNDVEIVGLEVDPATKRIKCEKLTIRNNASDPIRENVAQLQKVNEQLVIHGQNLIGAMREFSSMVVPVAGMFAPGIGVKGPLGIEATASVPALAELVKAVKELKAEVDALKGGPEPPAPASAPVE